MPQRCLSRTNRVVTPLTIISLVTDDAALMELMRAIASGDGQTAELHVRTDPGLALQPLRGGASRQSPHDYFFAEWGSYVYAGDTALHVAAFCYDTSVARSLVHARADVRAKNRRGAEPLHAAVNGAPGSRSWNPARQVAIITYLLGAGAEVDAVASGGVTPLHRAVRNRCSAAVRVLLADGADADRPNDNGSTARTLAHQTTGRGGTGSPEAKAEQAIIVELMSVGSGA